MFLFAIAAATLTASCYSSDYNRTVTANVALLSDMSDKLLDYCRRDFRLDGRPISSEEMGEFYYSFNKASAFSSSTPREVSRESHRDLIKMLNAYERFVHAADAYRLGGKQDPAMLASLTSQHDQVRLLAGKVIEDLRNEKR
ncbi:MAG: hypothetical protein Q7S58_18020 [Candidatus Binatus sp.]|uniref:hypothetical protein n=1 Tax=Candidatus Binatus sp. TaxID=2811406 RepID=UPI00271CBA46|nr:hypothetical protein [Candidatus Binatus sp.]MDO8434301.1 hypothetical protein [Candidatus Binatus sp.]